MTTEEKERAYEMALEAARKELCTDRKEWKVVQQVLRNIFPELRESEDERIRKFLITIVNNLSAPNFKEAERKDVLAWLEKQKEQKPADDNPLDDPRFMEGFDAGRSVQKIFDEPKPAWSEEDEMIRKAILGFLNPDKGGTKYSSCAELVKWSDWLKSLHPQPKQEWSEEDEKMRCNILNALTPNLVYSVGKGTSTGTSIYKYYKEIDWLKSLRPSWKPTEEQMEALMLAIEGKCPPTSYMSRRLEDLYDGLANTYKIDAKLD